MTLKLAFGQIWRLIQKTEYIMNRFGVNSEGRLKTKLYDKKYDTIFPLWTLHLYLALLCSIIPAAPAYGLWRVWRYQRGKTKNRIQWTKEKVQKDKPRSTKHTHKTKDRVIRTPLKTGVNSGDPEGKAVPAPLVAPVVLI